MTGVAYRQATLEPFDVNHPTDWDDYSLFDLNKLRLKQRLRHLLRLTKTSAHLAKLL